MLGIFKRLVGVGILGLIMFYQAGVDIPAHFQAARAYASAKVEEVSHWAHARLAADTWDGADPSHAGSYVFWATNPNGTPARFNSCAVIPVIANFSEAPKGAGPDLVAALKKLSSASGLNIKLVGFSNQFPSSSWGSHANPDGSYPPVLVAWAHANQSNMVSSADYAMGGPGSILTINGRKVLESGKAVIQLDGPKITPGFGVGASDGRLLLHELGHVLGLQHPTDQTQLMSVSDQVPGRLGAGDKTGLAHLGAGGCLAGAPAMAMHA